MYEITTISTKGQVTIPIQIRAQLHLQEGDRVRFVVDDNGALVLFPIKGRIADAYGILPRPSKRLSEADIKQTVADAAVERYTRRERD